MATLQSSPVLLIHLLAFLGITLLEEVSAFGEGWSWRSWIGCQDSGALGPRTDGIYQIIGSRRQIFFRPHCLENLLLILPECIGAPGSLELRIGGQSLLLNENVVAHMIKCTESMGEHSIVRPSGTKVARSPRREKVAAFPSKKWPTSIPSGTNR